MPPPAAAVAVAATMSRTASGTGAAGKVRGQAGTKLCRPLSNAECANAAAHRIDRRIDQLEVLRVRVADFRREVRNRAARVGKNVTDAAISSDGPRDDQTCGGSRRIKRKLKYRCGRNGRYFIV